MGGVILRLPVSGFRLSGLIGFQGFDAEKYTRD